MALIHEKDNENADNSVHVMTPEEREMWKTKVVSTTIPQRSAPETAPQEANHNAKRIMVVCWAAGLLQERGTVNMLTRQLTVQSEEEALTRLRKYFGGNVLYVGGYPRWVIGGKRAGAFVNEIGRYLGVKRRAELNSKLGLDKEPFEDDNNE